jgi:hypothetical protein
MSPAKLFRRALTSAFVCGLLAIGFAASADAQCLLNSPSGKIKHVVYVEFDNVHFTRDNPNVPSDLEQMPNLLNFIKQNGTLDTGDHAVLISHTANDILTTQTGLYSDNQGIFIANSFGLFQGGLGIFPSAFFYWTDKVSDITTNPPNTDNNFALTTPSGNNVPAPWAPFTRAGCDFGAFSTANIVLERAPFDVTKVFGAGSPPTLESSSNQSNDFIGASIHCALGSALCGNPANGAVADLLPSEPGGYSGYKALFGLKSMLLPTALGPISDYNGTPLTGFNQLNFDPTPAQTLAVIETMLKKGIPVVYAYIADAHDNEEGAGLSAEHTFGPGEAAYVKQLKDFDTAFGTFFANLKSEGIDQTNTLFIFTPDEGDHFVGGAPSPANCDGAKIVSGAVVPDVPCTYPALSGNPGVGEVDLNLNGVVANAGVATPFSIHFDDAPTVYVTGQPGQTDSSVRQLERTMGSLSVVNPHTGLSESLLGAGLGPELQGALVDQAAQHMVHMRSSLDPNREPTFTLFGNPNFFFETLAPLTNITPFVGTGFAWNHGDTQREIARTFVGIVGPGVRHLGVTDPDDLFTDHVDVRPTMMSLLGLKDDYVHDGRVILELLDRNFLPHNLWDGDDRKDKDDKRKDKDKDAFSDLLELGQVYKQIDAPFGDLAQSTLKISTYALQSDTKGDAAYMELEGKINGWTAERDALVAKIRPMLDAAEFNGVSIDDKDADKLIRQSKELLDDASDCASNLAKCAK